MPSSAVTAASITGDKDNNQEKSRTKQLYRRLISLCLLLSPTLIPVDDDDSILSKASYGRSLAFVVPFPFNVKWCHRCDIGTQDEYKAMNNRLILTLQLGCAMRGYIYLLICVCMFFSKSSVEARDQNTGVRGVYFCTFLCECGSGESRCRNVWVDATGNY